MWISKYQYDRLIERLEKCEGELRKSKLYIDKWPDDKGAWSNRYFEVPVIDVLHQIANHLGVKFSYKPGSPDTVTLEKRKK